MQEFTHEFAYHWFHTPTPIEKSGGLWPIRAGKNLAKPHYKMGPRMIPYYSIHFVLEGKGEFTFEHHTTSIAAGDFFCLLPNQTHAYKTSEEDPLQMIWLAFDGRQAKPIIQNIGVTPNSPLVTTIVDKEVKELLLDFVLTTSELTELSRLGKMYQLFSILSEKTTKQNAEQNANDGNWLERSLEFMETHYGEGITVEDVANYVGLHRSYLTSQFTEQMGYSPKKFITSCKMKQAAKMIGEKRFNITEIALTLGYSDLYSFSKAFKNYFGTSPSVYK